jgi:perosamine synthetase
MKRISELEREYVSNVLNNEFNTSLNSIYNSKLEEKFAQLFNVDFAIGHVNGTATLHTALIALGIMPGDEVIVPPLTMSSTSLAVLQAGAIPVFADVDINTFNISADSIRQKITKKTKAIMTVALYGLAPDYDQILNICKEFNLGLVEDNAECFLSKYKNKNVGEFGHFASFSFQASKHLTCGEGGMLITNDEKLANKARRFSSLGYSGVSAKKGKITREDIQDPKYDRHISLGFNYRMSELCAAVALGQLERANELVEIRIEVAKIFEKVVNDFNFIKPQSKPHDYVNSYWAYSFYLDIQDTEDWYKFRSEFKKNGGDGFYAAWKLTYFEPLFLNEIQNYSNVWQKYTNGLCVNSEYLQPRMVQLKTNYWNLDEAKMQAEILAKTLKVFSKTSLI